MIIRIALFPLPRLSILYIYAKKAITDSAKLTSTEAAHYSCTSDGSMYDWNNIGKFSLEDGVEVRR